jgi:hypothetical protein
MVLLLEPLVPAILEEIAAEHVNEVKERLRFAKSEMSFTDEFEHDIVEMGQGSKQPGLFVRLLHAIKQKVSCVSDPHRVQDKLIFIRRILQYKFARKETTS